MGAAVVGTLEITGFAAVMAIPLGILGAVYINEYGGNRPLAKLISFLADVMTGVPSIVMGLFIFTIWVLHFGYSGLAGSFALACLMLPIVIRSTYEMLRLVPDSLRQGSYALGATKARVTLTVVLPTAVGGIVSGCLLAVARAAGETAPLLFTILTVEATNSNLFSGADTALPTQIFVNASQPYVGARGPRLGFCAHPDRDHVHLDDRRPSRHRPLHPLSALGVNNMEQPEQEVVEQTVSTNLPRLETTVRGAVDGSWNANLRRAGRLDLLRLLQGRDGRFAADLRERGHRVHRLVWQRQVDRAARPQPDE